MDVGAYGVYFFMFLALYFEVFLLISFFERKPAKKSSELPNRYPTVTLVVPCFNEEATLAGTLDSLLALSYPKDKLSIVVVNDGSRDRTLEIAQSYTKHPEIQVFSKENGGKYTALNFAIERCESELVGCLDADSFVVPDALLEVVKKFEANPSTMAVVPAMKVHGPRNPLELMQAVEYTFGIFYKKMFDNLAAISVLPGPFSIYKRDVFNRIGLFKHAHNTEDMEMAFRMQANGLPIENAHTATVYTKVPDSLMKLVRQRTRWSQGFLQNSQDYRYMYFNPRYGYFGLLALPFGLAMFIGALYMVTYLLIKVALNVSDRIATLTSTKIPIQFPEFHFDWFYIDTSMLTVLIMVTLLMTLAAVSLGKRIAGGQLSFASYVSYFALYGFVAPLWLARAAWGAIRAQESVWR